MKKINFIFWAISILLCTSCIVDEQCRQNRFVAMKIDFFHVVANKTKDTIKTTVLSIDSVIARGLKFDTKNSKLIYVDSVLSYKFPSTSIFLPLQDSLTITRYEVKFNKTIDTLTIKHKNSDYYLSLECGCLKTHTIDSIQITKHFLVDSIKISNQIVNNTNAENIRLYK